MERILVGTDPLTYPAGTNIVPNPSFETNTTGWDLDSDFTRSSDDAKFGTYSIKQVSASGFAQIVTHNDSSVGLPVSINTLYSASFYYKLTINSGLAPIWYLNGTSAFGTTIKTGTLVATTSWTRVVTYFNPKTVTKVYFRIQNNNGDVAAFYDGFQLEATTPETNYIDGAQGIGFAWTGTANNSQSTRTPTITGGGRPVI